jgi:hypothetical protein
MTKEKKNLQIDQLVAIGNAIHDSYACIVLAANEKTASVERTITVALHGYKEELVQCLAKAMSENEKLHEIVTLSLLKYQVTAVMQKLEDLTSEEND